jgi:hypothetical protein
MTKRCCELSTNSRSCRNTCSSNPCVWTGLLDGCFTNVVLHRYYSAASQSGRNKREASLPPRVSCQGMPHCTSVAESRCRTRGSGAEGRLEVPSEGLRTLMAIVRRRKGRDPQPRGSGPGGYTVELGRVVGAECRDRCMRRSNGVFAEARAGRPELTRSLLYCSTCPSVRCEQANCRLLSGQASGAPRRRTLGLPIFHAPVRHPQPSATLGGGRIAAQTRDDAARV